MVSLLGLANLDHSYPWESLEPNEEISRLGRILSDDHLLSRALDTPWSFYKSAM